MDDIYDFMENKNRRTETEQPKQYIQMKYAGVSVDFIDSSRNKTELRETQTYNLEELKAKSKKFRKIKQELFKKLVQRMDQPLKFSKNKKAKRRRLKKCATKPLLEEQKDKGIYEKIYI